jgi:uncharacterized protein (DUF305 family)
VIIRLAWAVMTIVLIALGCMGIRACWNEHQNAQLILPSPIDVGFSQSMIRHHDQAVLMAQVVLSDSNSKVSGLARTILTKQLLEIGQMRGWLAIWGKPVLPSTRGMDWMLLGKAPPYTLLAQYLLECRNSNGGMPGLATTAEFNALRASSGTARDKLFLQLMQRHHLGALPMARFAVANTKIPAVHSLATEITFEQSEELYLITLLLRSMNAEGHK